MLNVLEQLPRGRRDMEAHLDALTALRSAPDHEAVFSHLYAVLSILDAKAASLLSFNSIVMAVFAIFLTGVLGTAAAMVAHAGTALILASSLLLLWVAQVHWSTTDDLSDARRHSMRLLEVRRTRTIEYRVAWLLSVAAIAMLVVLLIVR